MLAPEPAGRYRDPEDCASDLRRFLSHDPVLAADPDARTRRTIPPADSTPPRAAGKRWLPVIRLSVFGVAVLALVVWASREYNTWRDIGVLRGQLESHQIDPAAAWPEYKDLEKRSGLLPLLHGLRQSLKSQLAQKAEDVIEDYRRDQPTSREGDWSRAAKDLEHALELDPGDQSVMARLDLCEGHLLRIRAHGWVNRQRTLNQRMLNSAVGKFEDAARLAPDSADPFLGLARIYFYDLHEYEKGVEMLGNASSRGHPVGPREKEQMADGLRERGLRFYRESWQFRDMPDQRKTYLQMARENLQSAAQQYSSLGDFDPRTDGIYRDLLRRVAQVERELATLDSTQAALRPPGEQP
jgi:tetratricopeptide (TPR) repeat protein